MNHKGAFTLVEILICIVIIALLMAILFPVFFQARGKAQQATCESNLRSLGQAVRTYMDDHDGGWPLITTWMGGYGIGSVKLAGCPQAVQQPQKSPTQDTSERQHLGYAYNAELAGSTTLHPSDGSMETTSIRDKDVVFPTSTVSFCDAVVQAAVTQAPDPYKFTSPYPYGVEKGWERHSGGGNYLFCDGHVKWYQGSYVLPAIPPINDGTKPSFALQTRILH